MNNAFCGWMRGVAMALALAGLSSNANGTETEEIRFQGGHPWLSRNQMVDLEEAAVNTDTHSEVAIQGESNELQHGGRMQRSVPDDRIHPISKGRCFDLVIAMHKHREKDERAKIGLIVTNFARGVYEMTEGRHFIRKVAIIEYPGLYNADIHWWDGGGKRASTWSLGNRGFINIYDSVINNAEAGGGTLTHEWGHYEYGFKDEYREVNQSAWNNSSPGKPHSDDIAVKMAIMAGWVWGLPFKEQCNLSYAYDESVDETKQGKWRTTHHTAQYRTFGKSCLEQLVDPVKPNRDLLIIPISFKIPKWPEFSDIDFTKAPKIDLDQPGGEAQALKYLEIIWGDTQKQMVAICLDRSGSMDEVQLANAKENTKRVIDTLKEGAMIEVLAFDSYNHISRIIPFTRLIESNRFEMKQKVDSITSGDMTALWDAAGEALYDMQTIDPEGNNVKSILLMTDGINNDSKNETCASVIRKCQEMGVAFNSISYGENADSDLAGASSATGGKNIASSDSLTSLSEAFFRAGTYGSDRGAFMDSHGDTGNTGTWEETFTVDSTATNLQAVVTLSVPTAMANVVLKTPSGIRLAPRSTTDVGNESSWVFTLQSPEPGRWTVVVTAPAGTAVSCQVDASAVGDPPRMLVWTDEADTTVYAAVSQGLPVDGARVRALVDDNGRRKEVAFTAIGGGCYQLLLSACGAFIDGFTVRADADKGTATYTCVGLLDYEGDEEGMGITESFTRSEWLDLRRLNEIPLRYVEVHPRWPWEGKVDVDFHVVVTDKNTKVSAKLVGLDNRTGDAYSVSSVTCDDTLSDLGTGAHRLTWNAAADLPGMDIEDFAVRFDVTTGMALGVVTGLTASAGTYFDGVHVAWGAVANATGYRVYRSDTADGTGRVLLATQTGRTYTDSTAVIGKKYYYYWIQPIIVGTNGVVKHEGQLAVSGGAWRCQLGGVSGLSASGGSHYDGVHLSWTGANGATSYRIYRGTTANVASKTLLTTTSSTYYIDTSAAKLQKYYYYWVEPVAVVSGTTYTGAMNSSPVSGWRNKLGTPTFHFANWRPGHKSRPDIDLYIDSPVSGATRYEYMSGDQSWRWKAMESVGEGSSGYDISSMLYGSSATIGWAWAYRYELRVYVRAANNEGVGDWVKWNLADHLKESAFKNSEFYKLYPKP